MVHPGVISDPSSVDVTQVDSLIGLQAWVSFLGGDPACWALVSGTAGSASRYPSPSISAPFPAMRSSQQNALRPACPLLPPGTAWPVTLWPPHS